MKSFTNDVLIPKYFDKLNGIPERNRGDGFKVIFEYLDRRVESSMLPINIIETGCMRPGYTMDGDGSSTQLFDEFVNFHRKGSVRSIDITPEHAMFADRNTSVLTTVTCADSVITLWNMSYKFADHIDLLYLDSYDVDFDNPLMSNLHHMKEMISAAHLIRSDTLVAVDDCRFYPGDHRVPAGINPATVGKGVFVQDFMKDIGASLIFDGYQKVWKLN